MKKLEQGEERDVVRHCEGHLCQKLHLPPQRGQVLKKH
jgi:hypothetical protein